jgi:hypothetical protein
MSPDQMLALAPEVAALCAPHCWVFAWWPDPHLPQLLPFLTACGFVFSGKAFTWLKMRKGWEEDSAFTERDVFLGLGHTTRKQSETCWLARRGKPGRLSKGVRELIVAAVREHSRKRTNNTYASRPSVKGRGSSCLRGVIGRAGSHGAIRSICFRRRRRPASSIMKRGNPDMAITDAPPRPTTDDGVV